MPVRRAVMQVVRAATLRSAQLLQPMAAVAGGVELVLLPQVLVDAVEVSVQREIVFP